MNNNIRIVLVNPSHPGNIGAVARAMKTMELRQLYLVKGKRVRPQNDPFTPDPLSLFPGAIATAMAAGADDILEHATITSSLPEALIGSKIVFGTSARLRALQLPTFDPKTAAEFIVKEAKTNNIAILFGRENNGLTNEELELCNYHLHIPTNPDFSSLNIAQAVQIIAYEIKTAQKETTPFAPSKTELASTEEIQAFYQHLQQTLTTIKFLNPKNQKSLMPKLKRLFNRTQLEKNEINILRGILTAIVDPRQKFTPLCF